MAKHTVIGRGFLATALSNKLNASFYPTEDTKYLIYMDSVVHMDFEKNPQYHFAKVVSDFRFFLTYCKQNDIKFIYASSALVYEKDTEFADCKKLMEQMASTQDSLGLRIFPVFGKGENRTVISQWIKDIKEGKQPTIWGDGTQKRDFIYIDDFVDQVISSLDKTGIIDIGTGSGTSFNDIVDTINKVLGTDIKPIYIDRPEGYSEGIFTQNPLPTNTTLEQAIEAMSK